MFKDLNDFIDALDKRRMLARITEQVDPDLEIAAITDRVSKSPGGGPALLFENPTGHTMPVAINLFGSTERMCFALGVDTLDDLARQMEEITTPKIPTGILDAMKLLPMVNRLKDVLPLPAYGSKMGIDATRKWPSEGFTRPWPKKIATTEAARRKADEMWSRLSKGWKA